MLKLTALMIALIVSAQAWAGAVTPEDEAREYYKKGNIYYQQGMYKEAQDEYNKAVEVLKRRDSNTASQSSRGPEPAPVKKPPSGQAGQAEPAEFGPATEYMIGDDDILHISVWQNPDLDQEAIVRPDGKISVPLIGDVMARGLTITRLDDELTRQLSEYVRAPEVSISLRKIGGSKVILLGEISKPGVYSMSGQKTLLEAIGMAGGFTRDAVPSSIVLIRGGLVNPHAQRINMSKALKGKDFIRQNIVLQAEDVVFIPKKFIADLSYFLSQITGPLSQGSYISREYQSW